MNANQENRVSMYYKVNTFFDNNLATFIATAPGLLPLVNAAFVPKLNELGDFDQQATEINTGYAVQKAQLRTIMRDQTLMVAGGLKAYGLQIKDNVIIDRASLNKSTIDGARDTHALFLCDRLATLADDNIASLLPLGVTPAMSTALIASVAAYKAYIQNPSDARSLSSSAGEQVDRCIEEIDDLLEAIDGVMATQAGGFPLLYGQYLFDRGIDDNTGGAGTTPDVVITIGPGQTVAVFTIPYNAGREFKAKNNSADPINWGISTLPNSITNAVKVLNANSISTQLSSSLGPDGNNIVFQNTGIAPVEIELTIIE